MPIGLIGTVWAYKSLHETGIRNPGRIDWWGRFGARPYAVAGCAVTAVSFAGLLLLPTDFPYGAFALLVFLNGLGNGLFAAPNTSIIMSSVPPDARGAASGMRATFQNAGTVLSMGVFFSLMVAGLAGSLPHTLGSGLTAQHVPAPAAHTVATLPPVGVLFAAFLGYNPVRQLLGPAILDHLPRANAADLTGREFFPHVISRPFHDGLVVVFTLAIAMALIAAAASLIRNRRETTRAATSSPLTTTSAGGGVDGRPGRGPCTATVAEAPGSQWPLDGSGRQKGQRPTC